MDHVVWHGTFGKAPLREKSLQNRCERNLCKRTRNLDLSRANKLEPIRIMHFSSERPLTSRTRKRIEQLEDDEELAKVIAMEEDEKIAAKLQRDFENGIENNDFHRVNSRGEIVYFDTREEWENAEASAFNNQLQSAAEVKLAGKEEPPKKSRPTTKSNTHHIKSNTQQTVSSSESSPRSKKSGNFETQRASFVSKKVAGKIDSSEDDDEEGDDDEDSDLDDLARRIQKHDEDSVPQSGLTRKVSDEFLPKKKIDMESVEGSYYSEDDHLAESPSLDAGAVEKELKSLYDMIGQFQPETFELEQKLHPFLSDYIPCIGDIDPILKVSMPSSIGSQPLPPNLETHQYVGFVYLDEPHSQQSDPAVIDLALRAISLQETASDSNMKVRSIKLPPFAKNMDAGKTASHKTLQNWIDSVTDLQQKKNRSSGLGLKGASQVDELEKLMAEWPVEVDLALSVHSVQLPSADIDLNIKDFAKLCCIILDIPVKPVKTSYNGPKKQLIESLSSIFSVYLLFKNNQHFSSRV